MSKANGGTLIRVSGSAARCSFGCLVAFTDQLDTPLILSVAHGLVRQKAEQGDIIETASDTPTILGRLSTWTTFYTTITADAALVLADPKAVAQGIQGITRLPKDPNRTPQVGDTLWLFPESGSSSRRSAEIKSLDASVDLPVGGPDWHLEQVTYSGQIICEPMFSHAGDSGAIVTDDQNRVVGMVVAGKGLVERDDGMWTSQTIITPIASIFDHKDFPAKLQLY